MISFFSILSDIPPPRTGFASYWIDALVILAYFGLIMGIGFSQRGKSQTVEGFSLGDRQTPWWAVLASIIAAEISAATFLGAPGEGYSLRNWTYIQLAIGAILGRVFVSAVFIPAYYKHNVISIYEFLQTRFGMASRKAASFTFLLTRVLAIGTRLYVSAIIVVLAYEMFLGRAVLPMEKFWIFSGALIFISLMTAIYTTIGGIRAVIWTDFIQVGILLAAVGFSIYFLMGQITGGMEVILKQIKSPVFLDTGLQAGSLGSKAWWEYIFTNEYTIWAGFLGSSFVTMATHGIDQDTVQRMLTAKNTRQSGFATIVSGLLDVPITSAFIFIGILLSIYYQQNIQLYTVPKAAREVFPHFILHVMPAGLRGLVAAGILATAMGSLSTALNALATSFARDFVLSRDPEELPQAERVRVLRWSTLLFAGLIVLVGVITSYYMALNPAARIIPLVLGIMGYTFGSLLGIFFVALFTKNRGSDSGNIIAMIFGAMVVVIASHKEVQHLIGIQQPMEFEFPWRVLIGTIATFGMAVLFKTPEKANE